MASQEEQFRKTVTELRVAIAAVDVALFTIRDNALQVFLIPIHRPPHYQNQCGLPGGVIGIKENADQAAERHLEEKAHVSGVHIEQLYTFSDPGRDKRSRSISVAYIAIASPECLSIGVRTEGKWVSVKKLPHLAYDHEEVIRVALDRLKGKLIYTNIISNVLSKRFTLSELQNAYEVILDRKLDKRNFRKKMLSIGLIKRVGQQKQTIHRPAQLYTFSKKDLVTISEIRAAL
jgi:8-oxo-dGTP diphosphatase